MQRLVRARTKFALREFYQVPPSGTFERLASVQAVVYLIFNEAIQPLPATV
jgi:predicted RNA polymerase sigma factor